MPFVGNRGPIIIGVIIVIIFIGSLAVLASVSPASNNDDGANPSMPPSSICTCTINADLGVQTVIVRNLNTNSKTTVTRTEFPFSFNFTQNDVLSFLVSSQEGFTFDAWFGNDGFFYDANPYTFKATVTFNMNAQFTPLEMPNY